MKKIIYILLFPVVLFSQVNFSEDVSSIIYNNCTECHRVGQSGPMPFTSYEEVASLGMMKVEMRVVPEQLQREEQVQVTNGYLAPCGLSGRSLRRTLRVQVVA